MRIAGVGLLAALLAWRRRRRCAGVSAGLAVLLLVAVGLCVLGIVLRAWWPGKGAHTHPDKGDAA